MILLVSRENWGILFPSHTLVLESIFLSFNIHIVSVNMHSDPLLLSQSMNMEYVVFQVHSQPISDLMRATAFRFYLRGSPFEPTFKLDASSSHGPFLQCNKFTSKLDMRKIWKNNTDKNRTQYWIEQI